MENNAQNHNEEIQDIHDLNFEKWANQLTEIQKEDIFVHFYTNLRQSNGLLIELHEFWHFCWMFTTLEGQQFLEKIKEGDEICNECSESHDIDPDNIYHDYFIRWRLNNKNLMYDLYNYFYEFLLDQDGDMMDFDEFLFGIWRFSTLEGQECRIELEKEIIEDHKQRDINNG